MAHVSILACSSLAVAAHLLLGPVALAEPGLQLPPHLQALHIDKAWQITQGRGEIVTAILSSGINLAMADFLGSIALNKGEQGNNRERDGLDNDNNGYIDDVYGADVFDNRRAPWDFRYGSGTYLASLLVGANSNSFAPSGVRGVASGARILPVKVFGESGATQFSALKDGLEYALSRGVKVILLEAVWSGNDDSGVCALIARANLQGTLVVAPAGNTGLPLTKMMDPAACGTDNLVVVAALEDSGKLANFSSYGPQVHVAAPGRAVPGVDSEGKSTTRTGTFVAGALVAGVASLVWSAHPEYSPAQVRQALVLGADDNPDLYGKVLSHGNLNAYKAITVRATVK